MNGLTPELELVGRDLTAGLARLQARRAGRRRRTGVVAAVVAAFAVVAAVAVASGIGDELGIDPSKWSVFERGNVDGGQGAYVKAHAVDGSGDSTFMVEHDAGLAPYSAFLLHERVVAAAGGDGEQGAICTPEQLTRAEQVGLAASRASPAPSPAAVRSAVTAAFAGAPCRGLEYAAERARAVATSLEPETGLMPGAR